jgi:O-acetyl-ADP-ribose deacetylase (regulator of RNase III)
MCDNLKVLVYHSENPLKLTLIQDDITQLQVDTIVNAANKTLLGGGGVDGAIHRKAGPDLLAACKRLGGCETGQCKITEGFELDASRVIHTVGPIWQGGSNKEEELLASCYRQCLRVAEQEEVKTIAFPAISCGAYGFPLQLACDISVHTVISALPQHGSIRKVIFCAYSDEVHQAWLNSFQSLQLH